MNVLTMPSMFVQTPISYSLVIDCILSYCLMDSFTTSQLRMVFQVCSIFVKSIIRLNPNIQFIVLDYH